MKLRAYTYTNRGGRDHNEDSLRAWTEGSRGIYVLADGLGGHACGEVASALAVDTIFTGMSEAETLDEASLLEQFQAANGEILRRQGGYVKVASRAGAGSTFSLYLPNA